MIKKKKNSKTWDRLSPGSTMNPIANGGLSVNI